MEATVSRAVCDERHKNIDEKFDRDERRLNQHGETIDRYDRFAEKQTQINQHILEQLVEMQDWRKEQDKKVPNRVEFVLRQVIQWVTLGLLALIASKVGL